MFKAEITISHKQNTFWISMDHIKPKNKLFPRFSSKNGMTNDLPSPIYFPRSLSDRSQVMSACSKGRQDHLALKLFESMPSLKLRPNLISFSTVMSAKETWENQEVWVYRCFFGGCSCFLGCLISFMFLFDGFGALIFNGFC